MGGPKPKLFPQVRCEDRGISFGLSLLLEHPDSPPVRLGTGPYREGVVGKETLWPLDVKNQLIGKDLDAGKD